jgi:hypothetical protein
MCDAFDINNEKANCYKLNVLQNNHEQFDYGQLPALELHLGYDPPMLSSCLLLQIFRLQHQNTKHKINYSFIF